MGIKGLSTFVNSYTHSFGETVYLRDTVVVVDGSNLMYHLNTSPPAPNSHLVGGNYVAYAGRVREFCQKLKHAQITPIVIFDGAYDEGKLPTVIQRYRKSVKDNVHTKTPGNSYLPICMSVS